MIHDGARAGLGRAVVVRAVSGDVFVCHPLLVHAAQPHHGKWPRFLAQPPIAPAVPLDPFGPLNALSAVELAIRRGPGLP